MESKSTLVIVVGTPSSERIVKVVDRSAHVFVSVNKAQFWDQTWNVYVHKPAHPDGMKNAVTQLVSEHERKAGGGVLTLVVDGLSSEWQNGKLDEWVTNGRHALVRVVFIVDNLRDVRPSVRNNATHVYLTDANPHACELLGATNTLTGPLSITWDANRLQVLKWD